MGGRGSAGSRGGGGSGKALDDAIKAYTAQGGQYASDYPMTMEKRQLLQKEIDSSTMTTKEDIYRKVDITEADRDDLFYSLYNNDSTDINLKGLNSFTKEKVRANTYGGTQMSSVTYVIPKGTKIKAKDISAQSIYPQEQEVLVGTNSFKANYSELSFSRSGNMIITLRPKR